MVIARDLFILHGLWPHIGLGPGIVKPDKPQQAITRKCPYVSYHCRPAGSAIAFCATAGKGGSTQG